MCIKKQEWLDINSNRQNGEIAVPRININDKMVLKLKYCKNIIHTYIRRKPGHDYIQQILLYIMVKICAKRYHEIVKT